MGENFTPAQRKSINSIGQTIWSNTILQYKPNTFGHLILNVTRVGHSLSSYIGCIPMYAPLDSCECLYCALINKIYV